MEPWGRPRSAYVLDGRVMHVTAPTDLVRAVNMIVSSSPVYIILGSLRDKDDASHLIERLMNRASTLDVPTLDIIADALVKDWVGLERWIVARLWEQALAAWGTIDATMLAAGVDLTELHPARATFVVQRQLMKMQDPKRLEMWRQQLKAPPPRSAKKVESPETALAAFRQLQAATGRAG